MTLWGASLYRHSNEQVVTVTPILYRSLEQTKVIELITERWGPEGARGMGYRAFHSFPASHCQWETAAWSAL